MPCKLFFKHDENKPLISPQHSELANSEAVKAISKKIVTKLFKDTVSETASSLPITSAGGSCSPDNAADVSYTIRQFCNIWIDGPSFSAMGYSTAFNSVQGAIAAAKALERLKIAYKVKDVWGSVAAAVNFIRGMGQSAGGISFIGFRTFSIIAQINNLDTSMNATTVAGKGTFFTGFIGTIFFAIFYLGITVLSAINLCRLGNFKSKLNMGRDSKNLETSNNLKGYLEFLSHRLEVKPEKLIEKLASGQKRAEIGKKLEEEALDYASAWLLMTMDQMGEDVSSLTKSQCEEMVRQVFSLVDQENLLNEKERNKILSESRFNPKKHKELFESVKHLSSLEFLGLQQELNLNAQRKEFKLSSLIGAECIHLLKEAKETKLIERLNSLDAAVKNQAVQETKSFLEKIQDVTKKSTSIYGLMLVTYGLGFVVTILSFIFTGGILAIVVAVLFLVVCIGMHIGDGYDLHDGLKSQGVPGSHDKKLVAANMVVGVISLTAAITMCCVFSLGIIPLIAAVLIGIGWLVCNSISLAKLDIQQKRYALEHPDLGSFLKAIEKEKAVNKKIFTLFKHLSKADKKAIKSELCKKLGKTKDQRKFIDPQDAALDQGFDFGKEFFFEKTLDPDVLAAVKKSARILKEESVYGLLGYLQKNNETQACDYFQTKLSQKAKLHICEMIYNRRAKQAGSLFFQSAKSNIKDLEDIVLQRLQVLTQMQQTVNEERKKEIKEIDAHFFKHFISDQKEKTA